MANAVYVKRVRDADGAACQDCGHQVTSYELNGYWPWRQRQYLHERGMGHTMRLFAFTKS